MKNRLNCKKIVIPIICAGVVSTVIGFPQQVQAADEAILFGSESYEWNTDESYDLGIYATSDEVIESAEYTVTYDPEMLTLDSEDAVGENGKVRVSVDGNDTNKLKTTLSFIPQYGGTTQVTVEDIIITTEEGEVTVSDTSVASIHVDPDEECELTDILVNGVSVFSEDTEDYYLTVSGRVTEAEIQTVPEDIPVQISDTVLAEGENTIRILSGEEDKEQALYVLHITREAGVAAPSDGNTASEDLTSADDQKVQQAEAPSETAQKLRELLRNNAVLLIIIWAIAIAFVLLAIVRIQAKRQRKMEKAENYHKELIRLAEEKRLRDKQALADVMDLAATIEEQHTEEKTQSAEAVLLKEGKAIAEETKDKKPEIRVSHVTMDFKREKDEATSVKEMVIRTLKGQREIVKFRALDDVSFDVYKGEIVGIIGTNGSGKSTILKIISGALNPTSGKVEVNRKKLQLLTLGTGFDMELTGKENVYLNGSIIGYTKEYIDEVYDDIVKFAELEGFMDEKVRNYSSGMVSRLGFAIATTRDAPDILILDEVLSVGDMFFRKKSEQRIQEMMHSGCTVLIVSHSTGVIEKNCTKAVWIEKGKLRMVGDPKVVCKAYTELTKEENQ